MTEDKLDRVISLLETLVSLLSPKTEPVKKAGFFVKSSVVSLGGGARLVPDLHHQRPHESDESGIPPAGGTMDPATHWTRQPRGV